MLRACSNVSIHSRFTPLLPLGARRGITCTSCAFSQLAGQLKHNQFVFLFRKYSFIYLLHDFCFCRSTISSRSFYEGYDRTSKSKPNTGHILQDCDISLLKHLKITRRKIDSFINQISASSKYIPLLIYSPLNSDIVYVTHFSHSFIKSRDNN